MTYLYIALGLLAFWVLCGLAASGFYFAFYQREYPTIRLSMFSEAQDFAENCIFRGCVAFILCLADNRYKHGWLWPWSAKARKEAGIND